MNHDDLHSYQLEGETFLLEMLFAMLWLDLGLGKTIIVLSALVEKFRRGETKRALIIAPLRVAAQTWPTEIGKWEHTKHLAWTLIRAFGDEPEIAEAAAACRQALRRLGIRGPRAAALAARAARIGAERVRERLLNQPTPVHIINREAVPWLARKWGKKWPYDTVVYDESSGLRDYTTDRVRSLIHVRPKLSCLWELTGTPAPESYDDLFPQVYLLDKGERFGSAITKFRKRYFDVNPFARKLELKEGAADAIIHKIGKLALVMKAEDYLPVSVPVVVDRMIDLSDEEMERYQTLENEMLLSLDDGTEIVAETNAALWQKLLQFASGAVYDADKTVHVVHDKLIGELEDVIAEAQGEPVIVVYWHKSSLARLKAAFPTGRTLGKTGDLVKEWSAGKVPILFLHPASEGHGLNLQIGGHIMVFFDIPYSLELYLQIRGRIDRQGQRRIPMFIHLIARGTLVAGIVPLLKMKKSAQDYLLDKVKGLRQRKTGLEDL